jgi:hypothetical protein
MCRWNKLEVSCLYELIYHLLLDSNCALWISKVAFHHQRYPWKAPLVLHLHLLLWIQQVFRAKPMPCGGRVTVLMSFPFLPTCVLPYYRTLAYVNHPKALARDESNHHQDLIY